MTTLSILKKAAVKAIINYKGKKISPQKWVIIESDDWGSIRTSSKDSYQNLLNKGYRVNECPFNTFDALESNRDLEALFDTLHTVKDIDGNPAHITFNTVMTNPDFEKIKKAGFEQYHFEHFFETLKKYPEHDRVEELYSEGIVSNCMTPQFHGREHVHVNNWMKSLQAKQTDIQDAFEEKMFTVHNPKFFTCKEFSLDAWAMHNKEDEQYISASIADGLSLFESTFGFKSKSAMSACFSMSREAENTLNSLGVNHLQGAFIQNRVNVNGGDEKIRHYMGRKNENGQFITIRNANFEPSINPKINWVETVLQDVYWAFFWGKPAIINSHRLNFIGFLNEKNRTQNLKLLKEILIKIKERWPEVRFLPSHRLSEFYA